MTLTTKERLAAIEPRDLTCPRCGSTPKECCTLPDGRPTKSGSHMSRIKAVHKLRAREDGRQQDLFAATDTHQPRKRR